VNKIKVLMSFLLVIVAVEICHSTEIKDIDTALNLFKNRQYKESLPLFESLYGSGSTEHAKEIFVKYGIALIETKDYQKAVDVLSTGNGLYPKTKNANYNLGLAYYWLKEPETSLPYFLAETKVNPKNARAYFMYGYVSSRLGNYDIAERYMEKGIRMEPSSEMMTGVYNGYLTSRAMYFMGGNPSLALKYVQKAEKYYKNNLKTYELLSALYFQKGDFSKSVKACDQLIRLKPEIGFYHNNLANALLYEGKDFQRAKKEIDLAIQRNPDMKPFYSDTLAWAEYKLGNKDVAREILLELEGKMAKEGIPADMQASAFYHLGEIYRDAKDHIKAKEYYVKAVNLKAKGLETELAIKALKKIR
jgi:tetratricopeptide (TPR) repeat protein